MIYLLIIIIIFLTLTIVVLSVNFRRAQLSHNAKIGELQHVIVQLTTDADEKLAKLQLSDELRQTLKAAREKLDRDLMSVQRETIETLSKNNLIA